jgi:hypothetical protein
MEGLHFRECSSADLSEQLLEYEMKDVVKQYKIGLLYVAENQTQENDIYSNNQPSQLFLQFMNTIGDVVALKGMKS